MTLKEKLNNLPPWQYRGEDYPIDDAENWASFVYVIHHTPTGKKYIGKKVFHSIRTLPPLKGKKRKRKVKKDSGWQKYMSSSKILAGLLEEGDPKDFIREILLLAPTRAEANYSELVAQVMLNVLQARDQMGERVFLNENIDRIYYHNEKTHDLRCEFHQWICGYIKNNEDQK